MLNINAANLRNSRKRKRLELTAGWIATLVGGAGALWPIHAIGQNTTYQYDALGRLIQATYPDTSTTNYNYDPAGNRTTVAATGLFPAFSVNDVSASEGGNLSFTITRSAPTAGAYSVTYATANDTATAGVDYTSAGATINFASGQTTFPVTIQTLTDTILEGHERVLINLSNPSGGATLNDPQGVGTIIDVPPPPDFTINDVTVAEGSQLGFTVTRNGSTSGTYSVNYSTGNGTATSGLDYTSVSGTLNFATGVSTMPINVPTLPDSLTEGNETVLVNLAAASGGATISDPQGAGTITNVVAPSFSIGDASGREGETLQFIVFRSGSTAGTYAVSYSSANGTATAGSDYGAVSGTLTFGPGVTSRPIPVNAIYDTKNNEPAFEQMFVNLHTPTNGATLGDSQGAGTIENVLDCGGLEC